MCYLCLQDFDFVVPVVKPEPVLEQKKKRLLKVKSLLQLATLMAQVEDNMAEEFRTLCEGKIKALKEEQYALSREF